MGLGGCDGRGTRAGESYQPHRHRQQILARDIVLAIARELDASAWRRGPAADCSPTRNRQLKTIAKAGRIWRGIAPLIKEKFFDASLGNSSL
jgi:hypothetical protein